MGAFSANSENSMLSNMSNISLHTKHVTDIHKIGKARENVYFRKQVWIRIPHSYIHDINTNIYLHSQQYDQLQKLKKINEEQKAKINEKIDELYEEIEEISTEIEKMKDDKWMEVRLKPN